jgi:hypothetical protein
MHVVFIPNSNKVRVRIQGLGDYLNPTGLEAFRVLFQVDTFLDDFVPEVDGILPEEQ